MRDRCTTLLPVPPLYLLEYAHRLRGSHFDTRQRLARASRGAFFFAPRCPTFDPYRWAGATTRSLFDTVKRLNPTSLYLPALVRVRGENALPKEGRSEILRGGVASPIKVTTPVGCGPLSLKSVTLTLRQMCTGEPHAMHYKLCRKQPTRGIRILRSFSLPPAGPFLPTRTGLRDAQIENERGQILCQQMLPRDTASIEF